MAQGNKYKSNLIELDAELVHETEKAWLLNVNLIEVWLPKSRVEFDGFTVTIQEDFAQEKGII